MLEAAVAEFPQRPEYHEELAFLYERRAIQLCRSGELPGAVAILRKLARDFPERPGHRSQVVRLLTALPPVGTDGRGLTETRPGIPGGAGVPGGGPRSRQPGHGPEQAGEVCRGGGAVP